MLGEREAQKEERTNNLGSPKNLSFLFTNWSEETTYKLPPPIYTCIEGGKVVINIAL